MEQKVTYVEKLKNCIKLAFENHPNLPDFLSYKVRYKERKSNYCGALYYLDSRTIYINLDSLNRNDLLLSVLIHEVSHHVEFMQEGYTKHDKTFRFIQEKILDAAFELGYINPYRLIVYYDLLSHYTEKRKVIKMCRNYVARTDAKDAYFNFIKFNYNQRLKDYLKNDGFTFFNDGEKIGWYKFYDNETVYKKDKAIFDKARRERPSLLLNYVYTGKIS